MSRHNRNASRAGFYRHLDAMRKHQKDIDTFLAANRLQRHERPPMQKGALANAVIIGITTVVCAALALGCLFGYFIHVLIGAGILITLGVVYLIVVLCE